MDFTIWKNRSLHKGKFFIGDGIIDESKWINASVKILFLLKEAYDSKYNEHTEWNINDKFREEWKEPFDKIWWSVAQWAYGINKLKETHKIAIYPEHYTKDQKIILTDFFMETAIVNLKKSHGISSSSPVNLAKYVEQDWDLTWNQIQEINPEIIVCGNTLSLFRHKLNITEENRIGDLVYKYEGKILIDFWHPSNRYPYKMNYYTIVSILHEANVFN